VDAAFLAEIEKVKSGGVAEWEIEKARTSARRNLVGTLQSSLSRAIQLSQDALMFDDPNRINTRAAKIAAVTAADVQRVARQYLTPGNRTVVITNPKAGASTGGRDAR
jgi:predicted Zn-dependent peptidase